MAIVTRRYQQRGPSDNDLTDSVQAGATVVGFSGGVVDIQIDNTVDGSIETLNEFMVSLGFEFLEQAPAIATVLRVLSPDATLKSISVADDATISVDGVPALGLGAVSYPARAFNTTFQPSTTRPTLCIYSIRIVADLTLGGAESGRVELVSDAAAPPVTVQCRMAHGLAGTLVLGVTITSSMESVLVYLVPAGHNVRLNTINETTAPTYTLVRATEIAL